ncbi:MAG: hypothetical protein KC561_20470, partial [Myxococcales bacterium]|nr:hypothetical protein [Myxococcales bacterium]
MSSHEQQRSPASRIEGPSSSSESLAITQFKSAVAGMSFADQQAAVAPQLPVQFLPAVQMVAEGFITPTIAGTVTSTTVSPFTRTTQDPTTFPGSVRQYETNWTYVTGRIRNLCSDNTKYDPALVDRDIGRLTAKKSEWYDRWGRAALNSSQAAARTEFQAIHGELATVLPEDAPEAGGGHLYTGRAGTRGKDDAQSSADTETARTGIKHTSLEQTLIGRLFDDCAWQPPDYIQWNDVVAEWWGHISAAFADTFEGKVTCHVNVGVPYFVIQKYGSSLSGKPAAEVQARAAAGEFNGARELDKSTVFAVQELGRLAAEMGSAGSKVSDLELQLKVDIGAG